MFSKETLWIRCKITVYSILYHIVYGIWENVKWHLSENEMVGGRGRRGVMDGLVVKGGKFHWTRLDGSLAHIHRHLSYVAFQRTDFQLPTWLLGKSNHLFRSWHLLAPVGRLSTVRFNLRGSASSDYVHWSVLVFVSIFEAGGGKRRITIRQLNFNVDSSIANKSRPFKFMIVLHRSINVSPIPLSHQNVSYPKIP